METCFLRNVQKFLLFVGFSLVVFVPIYQLSRMTDLGPRSPLLKVNVVTECYQAAPTESVDGSDKEIISKIPNIIHQIQRTSNLPWQPINASHQSWKDKFEPAGFTVKLWREDDIVQLIRSKYPWMLSTYLEYPRNIERTDMARLLVIHAEGGVYVDADVYPTTVETLQCLQRLGMQAIFTPTAAGLGVSDDFFMAEKGSELVKWTLQETKRRGTSRSEKARIPYLGVFPPPKPMMATISFLQYAWLYSGCDRKFGVLGETYTQLVIKPAAETSPQSLGGRVLNHISDNTKVDFLLIALPFSAMIPGLVYIILKRNRGRILI